MKMDQQNRTATSRLFNVTIVDVKKDEIEEKYERGYQHFQSLISGLSDKETIDTLTSAVNREKSQEELICLGMIMVILTEPHNAEKIYQDLRMLNRDGFQSVTQNTCQLILERYTRLHDVARCQMLWLVREMVRNMVPNVDTLCWNLMRHAASGDVSPKNLYLIENLLDIYQENKKWLEKFPWLLASVVYSFLRFIEDHSSSSLAKLRQKEVTFVVSLLRERFMDCYVIGRDLVRLLQNVSRIPEIESLWKDILQNPTTLAPNFTGVLQLLQTRTSRRFLQSRLTPDMERKLVFFTSSVRFGNHKRYQEWFQKQYLATPESQSLRSDLIRFIVGVIHPTNELLCSDIIPRWAVIGWLITTCTSNIALANAKLALFYDWLFFEPGKDNIMNIEPAILVMNNSQKTHSAVTASLLDFLCRIIPNFYPPITDVVRNGVFGSLYQILDKRVLPSLLPLFDNPKLDRELRSMIKETFGEFCDQQPIEGGKVDEPIKEECMDKFDRIPSPVITNNHNSSDVTEPSFSDEESEPSVPKPIKVEEDDDDIPIGKLVKVKVKDKHEEVFADAMKPLKKELKDILMQLYKEKNDNSRTSLMEDLVSLISDNTDLDAESLSSVASCLNIALSSQFEEKVFPEEVNDKNIEESIDKPMFMLFRGLVQSLDGNSKRIPFFTILTELRSLQRKIGYLLLYYLHAVEVSKNHEKLYSSSSKGYLYKEFCHNLEKKIEDCLYCDLETCQEDDCYMFCWLIPAIYKEYPKFSINNDRLLHLITSSIDAKQLQELSCKVLQGQLVMFQPESFVSLITASLSWETFEQFCLWQLALAHNVPIECMLNTLPKLEFKTHAEALTSIMVLLRRERPSTDLLKPIFCRELKPITDIFVVSILQAWCADYCDVLANCVADLLTSRCPTASPSKRKRGQGQGLGSRSGVSPPSAERILAHLDRARHGCIPMFKVDSMQKVLQIAQAACTDTQRGLYSSLFALLDDEEPVTTTNKTAPSTSKGRGRKAAGSACNSTTSNSYSSKHRSASNRTSLKELSDSSESSSEEEEVVKPRNTKKRKKINAVTSDSD